MTTAYRRETELLTAERIPQTAILFLLLLGSSGAFEHYYAPERLALFSAMYAVQAFICIALVTLREPLRRRGTLTSTAIAAWALLGASLVVYGFIADTQPELTTLAAAMFLMGISMMMPWGSNGQLMVSIVVLSCDVVRLVLAETRAVPAPYLGFALIGAGALSIVGARSFDLHRLAIFRESTEREAEASLNRTLLAIGATMNSSLDAVDVLDRIAYAVRNALGFEWSVILLSDERRQAFRIAGGSSHVSMGIADMRTMEISTETLPVIQRVLEKGYVEVIDPQALESLDPVSAGYVRRYRLRGVLATTLVRGGQIVGILAVGSSQELAGFSESVRQLFRGIAQHAAIALDNVRLVANLRQADRLKSEFVSTMSHELRTPMNVILGYSDLLLDGAFERLTDEQRHIMRRLRDSARSLLDLINATLEVNRFEAGRSSLQEIEFDLDELLADVHGECEELPRSGSVSLLWDNESTGARVRADARKLKIILKNLIGNALKFTATGCVVVRSRYERAGEMIEVGVTDTGPGIDEAELPEIFEMFQQAEFGRLRGGVGLGLYIVKRFIDQLGGRIDVASRLGQGSTFTVTVPAAASERADQVRQAAAS